MQTIGTNNCINKIYGDAANINVPSFGITVDQAFVITNNDIDTIGDQIDTLNSQMVIVGDSIDDLSNIIEGRTAIYTFQVHLTTANILALGGSPIQLLPAPGSGRSYLINGGNMRINSTGFTAFTGGNALALKLGTQQIRALGTATFVTQAASSMLQGFTAYVTTTAIAIANIQNQALNLTTTDGSNFATGTGSLDLELQYSILDLPP